MNQNNIMLKKEIIVDKICVSGSKQFHTVFACSFDRFSVACLLVCLCTNTDATPTKNRILKVIARMV